MTPRPIVFRVACVALGLASAMACRSFELPLPSGFAEYEQAPWFELKAANPDGVRLRVRDFDNDPEGSLELWAAAVGRHFLDLGYDLQSPISGEAIRSTDGTEGRLFRSVRKSGQPTAYWVAIYLKTHLLRRNTIHEVEIYGPVPEFEKQKAAIEAALSRLRIRTVG